MHFFYFFFFFFYVSWSLKLSIFYPHEFLNTIIVLVFMDVPLSLRSYNKQYINISVVMICGIWPVWLTDKAQITIIKFLQVEYSIYLPQIDLKMLLM